MDRLCNDYRKLELKERCKTGWIETHYPQKELLRKSYASVVVIGGDRVEIVLWHNNDIALKSDQSLYTAVRIISTPAAQMKKVWVLLLLLDPFPIITQIPSLLLVVCYQETFLALREE